MSEVKTYQCDKCRCQLSHDPEDTNFHIIGFDYSMNANFFVQGKRQNISLEEMDLDFCSNVCMQEYLVGKTESSWKETP